MIVTASALVRCGLVRKLRREKPRTSRQREAMDRGTLFHRYVEEWVQTGRMPETGDLEALGWLELLARAWHPPAGVELEVAVGLDNRGEYVPVWEQPLGSHVYVPKNDGALVTAGRADAVWFEDEDTIRVVDWKTGLWPPEDPRTNLQLWALGIAAARRAQIEYSIEYLQVGLYHARDGAFDWAPRTRIDDGDAWDERVDDVLTAAALDESPRPAPERCCSCWERRNCDHAVIDV